MCGSRYEFRVAASNPVGLSKWGASLVANTMPDVPSAPEAPRLVGRAQRECLGLQWSPPKSNGNAPDAPIYSLLFYSPADATAKFVYRGPDLTFLMTGLSPGGVYKFALEAANSAGTSPRSENGPAEVGRCLPWSAG